PTEFRVAVGTRVYGCDDCQDACPPNRRAVRSGHVAPAEGAGAGGPLEPVVDLEWLLTATDGEVLERLGRFYIPGRDVRYLRRNALVALGNLGERAAVALVAPFVAGADPLLRRHAAWALGRLGGPEAGAALGEALATEDDPAVRSEMAAGLREL